MELWNSGITFDYASGDLLSRATVKDGKLVLGGNAYRALVLPGVKRICHETLEKILALARPGSEAHRPRRLAGRRPGISHDERSAAMISQPRSEKQRASRHPGPPAPSSPRSPDSASVRKPMTAAGLRFVRRSHAGATTISS